MKTTKLKTMLLTLLLCLVGGANVWGDVIRPTYVDSSTGGDSGQCAKMLVDASGTSTKWCWSFTDGMWITVQANNTVLKGYELYNGNDTYSCQGRRWKNWTVEGSNDNSTWTTIQTVTDASMNTTNYGCNIYTIDNNTTQYSYYRFKITANNGDVCVQMSDLLLNVIPAETTGWNLIGFKGGCYTGCYTLSIENNISFDRLATPTYAAWGNSTGSNLHQSGDQGIYHQGTSWTNSVDISIAIYHYTLSIPSYSKLVRTASYTLWMGSTRHLHGGGVYLFDDYSTATSTALDATYNQSRTEGNSYKITKGWDLYVDGGDRSPASGTGSMTFDNSTGSNAQLISKYLDLLHSSGNAGDAAAGTEWIAWMESSQNNEWHYYKYVTFDANGGTGSISQLTIDNSGTLPTNTITHTGYTFAGWNTQADGSGTAYADGGAITATSDSKGPVTLYAQWTPNATMGGTVITPDAALTLNDGSDLVVNNPVTVSSISYSRNLTYDWGTICLPFEVSSDANVQYYTLQSVDATAEKVYFEPATTIAANTPAVFKRLNSGNYSAESAGSVTLSATLNPSETGSWKLVGTFASKTLDMTNNANDYYIAQNQFWQVNQSQSGVTIPAYRAYFTTSASGAKATSFTISIWDGNEATAIGTINANGDVDVDGVYPELSRRAPAYNLAGQRVNNNAKGILIINGKKIIK